MDDNQQNDRTSQDKPGLVVILVDHSGSMKEPCGSNGESRAVVAADAVNEVIFEIILRNDERGSITPRMYFSVIGYDDDPQELLYGRIDRLNENFLATKTVTKGQAKSSGGVYEADGVYPVWVEPKIGGVTRMDKAFEQAAKRIKDWIQEIKNEDAVRRPGTKKTPHRAVVLHLTDGDPTGDDGIPAPASYEATQKAVDQLRASVTEVPLLVMNAHIGAGTAVRYPKDLDANASANQKMLFATADSLTEAQVATAYEFNVGHDYVDGTAKRPIDVGAAAYIFNGKASDVVGFLVFGSFVGVRGETKQK